MNVSPSMSIWTLMDELKPPVPNLIMLGVLLLCTIGVIVAGYFHGKMHLLTVLKNAVS